MKYALLFLLGLLAIAPAARAQAPAAASAPAVSVPDPAVGSPQRYSTATGLITFFSTAPLEDIEALNSRVAAIFEMGTHQLAFSLLMRDFQFKNSLMQEHFNENYAESEKYPRARFTGELLTVPGDIQLLSGPQPVVVQGFLTIHNVAQSEGARHPTAARHRPGGDGQVFGGHGRLQDEDSGPGAEQHRQNHRHQRDIDLLAGFGEYGQYR